MDSNICYNCGAVYDRPDGGRCPDCGAVIVKNELPKVEKRLSAAFLLLRESQFDEAKTAFEAILKKYPENALAYWGRFRARYHITYVLNADGKQVAKCPTRSGANIFEDTDYLKATEYADNEEEKAFLQAQAERIKAFCTERTMSKNLVVRFTFGEIDPNDAFVVPPKKSKKPLILSAVLAFVLIAATSVCFATGVFHKHEPGAEANCTEDQICVKCNEILVTARGHTPGAEANCTEAQNCTVCNTELKAALGHKPGEWKTEIFPTDEQDGLRVIRCMVCNEITDKITVSASQGLAFVSNGDGTCSVSGIGTCTDTEIVIPAIYNGRLVTIIGSSAFRGCNRLTSISIPDHMTRIDEFAFRDCSSLMSIVISEGVIRIGYEAFRGCSSLTSIVIPDGVTSIGEFAFHHCNRLTSISIPDSMMSIGDSAFRDCSSLTEISVHENNAYYCSENGILFNKSKTELICYPAGKTETSYSIPDSVTSIGYEAFSGCSSLTSISIPGSVTRIGGAAFSDCNRLTSIEIPEGVTSIGSSAFSYCRNLTSIQFDGTTAQWSAISFGSYWNNGAGSYTITCTDGTIAKNGTVTYH